MIFLKNLFKRKHLCEGKTIYGPGDTVKVYPCKVCGLPKKDQ